MNDHTPETEAVPVDELRSLREDAARYHKLVEIAKTRTVVIGKIVFLNGTLGEAIVPDPAENLDCTACFYGTRDGWPELGAFPLTSPPERTSK